MSNKFSQARGTLKRPKVCRPPPPPPPTGISCDVEPDSVTMEAGTFADISCKGRNTNFDLLDNIDLSVGGAGAFELEPQTISNNDQFGDIELQDEGNDPGTYAVVIIFTWPDDSTCESPVSAEVTEEP